MITVVFECPGSTILQYDEACRLGNVSQANLPEGLIFHSASPTEPGFLVVDVWESEGNFKAFLGRLAPAMQEAGVRGEPKIYRTHAVMGSGLLTRA
jgi:hypothetical protein